MLPVYDVQIESIRMSGIGLGKRIYQRNNWKNETFRIVRDKESISDKDSSAGIWGQE